MTMHPDDRQQPARLNVRLDDKLRSRIEAAAQASRRSMNAEICHRIEQAFIEQPPRGDPGVIRGPFINSISRRPAKKMPGRTDMRTRQKEVTRGRYTIGADPQ